MFQKFGGFGFGPKFARPQNYTYGGIYGTGYGYGGGYGGYGSPVYGVQPGAARYYYNRPVSSPPFVAQVHCLIFQSFSPHVLRTKKHKKTKKC